MVNQKVELLKKLFVNRDDVFAQAYLNKGKMAYNKLVAKLDEDIIKAHLSRKITIGCYQLKLNKVKWACLDFDENTQEDFERAKMLYFELKKQGLNPLMENSGGGEFKTHIWVFCDCGAKDIFYYLEDICEKIGIKPHEIFPKQFKATEQSPYGNLVKLPLAYHLASKQRSYFFDDDFKPITDEKQLIKKLQHHLENKATIPKIIIKEKIITEYKPQSQKPNEFDGFFNYVLSHDLPKGISVTDKASPKTEGINTNVLKNLAIWFYQKGYTLEQLEQEVKPIYDKNGWAFADLKGWFKKAQQGSIKEISIGELYNWATTYKPEMIKLLPKDEVDEEENFFQKQKNPYTKLHYSVDHLPFFHEFSSLINLPERHYIPILKCRWYQLHGGILQKPIKLGALYTDTRIHCAYPLPTEAGKNELIYGSKVLINSCILKGEGEKFTISEPISYSPESLVGKYVEKLIPNPDPTKKKMIKSKVENRGHLNNDFLEFDECTKLIVSDSPETQQAREYLSKAENPIGRNIVEKRLVDDLPSETVAYSPKGTHSYYFQPFKKIPETAMLQGFMRRKLIPVGNVSLFLNSAEELSFKNKLESETFSRDDYIQRIVNHLENMQIIFRNVSFIFTDEAQALLSSYSIQLSNQGNVHSEKIANYCKISKWSTLSNLVKMSCIIAGSYGTRIVNENAVSLAYMDLVEFLQNTFDFIYSQVLGDFDYGATWHGANYYQKECLRFLFREKALSLENSTISIYHFLEEIVMPVFKIKSMSQARNKYLEMKKEGLINSKQTAKNDSRVWLNFNPNDQKTYFEDDKGFKGYSSYNAIFESRNKLSSSLKSLAPLKPLDVREEKVK